MRIIDECGTVHNVADLMKNDKSVYYTSLCYKSDGDPVDFYNTNFLFTKVYTGAAYQCSIDDHKFILPVDWLVLSGSEHADNMEFEPIVSTCKQDIPVFVYSVTNGFMARFAHMTVDNVYFDYEWQFPQLKTGHMLGVPISSKDNSECVWIAQNTRFMPKTFELRDIL